MKRILLFLLIFLYAFAPVSAQKSKRVRDLEQQRKSALEQIESTNKLLQDTKKSKQTSLKRLNLLTTQIQSRKKVILLLSQELSAMDSEIKEIGQELENLQEDIQIMQDRYAESVRKMATGTRSIDRFLFIFSADDFAQSMRRMRYLREYSEWNKSQVSKIKEKRQEFNEKKRDLEQARAEKNDLFLTKNAEQNKLNIEEANQKKQVDQLKKKQSLLEKELRKHRAQARALNNKIKQQIAKEIEEANKKAQGGKLSSKNTRKPETKGGYAMTIEERKLSSNFASNRGHLPPPISGRYSIVGRFGTYKHPQLKHVTINNSGIDLQGHSGCEARAIFNGIVSKVFVVSGFNNSVIIRHGNYLTVYSNLSEVSVRAGDHVVTGQKLGTVYSDSEEGNATILHFQLWKERTPLNPASWFR